MTNLRKPILSHHVAPKGHWVGDGFPVHSLFNYRNHGALLDPFLLLDHAGPAEFPPAEQPRGVDVHPHRGFETVTIVLEGEVAHRDSAGNAGLIGPGDVQWMTAGAGIVHEEFHGEAFTRRGGVLHMVQLWVNLPARAKETPPGYQSLLRDQIPVAPLPEAGSVRVIAGRLGDVVGPARTATPMNVWEINLPHDAVVSLPAVEGWKVGLVGLTGTSQVNGERNLRGNELVILGGEGDEIHLEANGDVRLLLLSGEPLAEPVVGHGPFVMNTVEELRQAFADFEAGRYGSLG